MYKRLFLLIVLFFLVLGTVAISLPAIASHQPDGRQQYLRTQRQPQATKGVSTTTPFVEDHVHIHYNYEGDFIGDLFGWIGTNLGDLNGDGVHEFSISAIAYSDTTTAQGRIYIHTGLDGSLIHTTTGNTTTGLLGYSVAAAGDVNNDGTPDYIVGAPGTYAAENEGQAVVYSGVDHTVLHTWTGNPGWRFGISMAGIGDVDGDGFADVAVGSTAFSATLGLPFHNGLGRVYAYSGQDGSLLWTHTGSNPGDAFGGGLGRVGDVNGDTIPDVVAAAHWGNAGNGYARVLSGDDGTLIHSLAPTPPLSNTFSFGRFFARGAGDINDDGTDDIFIGDYSALNGAGRVYIYSGTDGSIIHQIEAEQAGDGLGPGRGVPDVNGDGHDDFVAAAYTSSDGSPGGGKIYLFSGADGSVLQVATGNIGGDNLGVDALPLGDITGDGYGDYLVTAVGLDFAGVDVGRAYVISFKTDLFLPIMRR